MEVVAETTPLLAWRGPFRVERVRPPFRVWSAVKVLAVYVFGMVVEAWM